jgi:hypothetical protein
MVRFLFGALLLAHGAVHFMWLMPEPDDPKWPFRWRSPWMPSVPAQKLRGPGTAVIALLFLGYAVAALGVWGVPFLAAVWVPAAVLASVLSVAITAVLWNNNFIANPIIDALIVAAALLGWIR